MKYEPLKRYLEATGETSVSLSFEQIEQILGSPLPASARKHPAWWSNSPAGHVNAQAWLDAGYHSEQVDLAGARLVFARRVPTVQELFPGVGEAPIPPLKPSTPGVLERLRELLGGTVWIAPGVDLTEPIDVVWNAEIE